MTELPDNPDVLLTRKELAALIKCGRNVLKEMEDAGYLPDPTIMAGKTPRWSVGVIRGWIRCGGLGRANASILHKAGEFLPNSPAAEKATRRKNDDD